MFKSFISIALIATLSGATQLDSDAEFFGKGKGKGGFAGKIGGGKFGG